MEMDSVSWIKLSSFILVCCKLFYDLEAIVKHYIIKIMSLLVVVYQNTYIVIEKKKKSVLRDLTQNFMVLLEQPSKYLVKFKESMVLLGM